MRAFAVLLVVVATAVLGGCRTSPTAASSEPIDPVSVRQGVALPVAYRFDEPAPASLERAEFLTQATDPCCPATCLTCWQPSPCRKTYLDGAASFLPNLGIGFGGGHVISRRSDAEFALEVQGVWQFVDDETFADDGNPEAGDWYQVRAGMKIISNPNQRRHATGRFGAVFIDANGEPNILQEPGTYYGIYGGLGFETDITSRLTIGPEVTLMLVTQEEDFDVEPVPQLNWHVIYWLNGSGERDLQRAPYGEVYAGAALTLSPGIGGGIQFGQVMCRKKLATWSFEMMAGAQDTTEDLWFDESGDYAQIRGGIKAVFDPCSRCGHWTGRFGATWLRSTARNEFLDVSGDYIGAYLGVGYEWDLGQRFATGPELVVNAVAREGGSDFEWLPQLNWHFIVKL